MSIDEEDAIRFNALYASDKDGVPFIENWIKQYGSEAWTVAIFSCSDLSNDSYALLSRYCL